MLERAETDDRLYLVKSMVSLFCRPILPSYNKGKNTILSCPFFLTFFLIYATASQSSANLEHFYVEADNFEFTSILQHRKIAIFTSHISISVIQNSHTFCY